MFSRFARALLFVAFATFLILASMGLAAAAPITGRVVDEDGRPVPGARVFVSSGATATVSAETDSDGRFTLHPVGEGRATVRVALDGFRAEAVTIDSTASPRDLGTLTLTVSAISEAIVVSANQVELPLSEVASSVTVIEGADARIATAALGRRRAAERSRPGRGEHRRRSARDDRPVPARWRVQLHAGRDRRRARQCLRRRLRLRAPATANIDRIEVVRGPQSALFGANAIGSVVRIVSRRGGPPSGLFQVEAGHYGTSRVAGSTAGSHGGIRMGCLLRSAADRRHERREHGRRRDRRQRRLHAAHRSRHRSAGAAARRGCAATCGMRWTSAAFPVRSAATRSAIYGGIDIDVARRQCPHAGGRRLVVAAVCALRSAGAGELQRDRQRLRQPVRRVPELLAPRDGPRPVGLHHTRRAWTSRRAWSSSASGPAAPTSPACDAQEIPVVRGIEGYFVEGRWASHERCS